MATRRSRRLTAVGGGAGVGLLLGSTLFATPANAGWADSNCTFSDSYYPTGSGTRSAMDNYMWSSNWEGYHWGGGCDNDDNVDNQPGDPTETTSTHGEGTDCSGYVRKAWAIQSDSTTAFGLYAHSQYTHGPYTAASYRSGTTAWKTVANGDVGYWDALASTSHIAIVTTHNADGSDIVQESKAEAVGTGYFTRTYRGQYPTYTGARRIGWS